MENKQKKMIILVCLCTGILLLTLGITYAIFSYNQTGEQQQLVLGDIYMHYNETNQLVLENAMPSSTYDENNYFEFVVSGKNTYTKNDIWYEVTISHGDEHETRTTRIKDNLLKFTLVEIDGETETIVVDGESYEEINNTRIWINRIPANTLEEINKTYRLYVWISNETTIGNTGNEDYDVDTWNEDVYASIKVGVSGDFREKSLVEPTDASCFDYTENEDGTITLTSYYYANNPSSEYRNPLCGTVVVFPSEIDGKTVTAIGDDIFNVQSFTGIWEDKTPSGYYGITRIIIPDTVTEIGSRAFWDNQLTSVTFEENSNLTTIGNSAFYNNALTSVEIPASVTTIGNSAFSFNNLTSVEIPASVTTIGDSAFSFNNLTSVTFEENSNLTTIGNSAFTANSLTSVEIPNSVTTIGYNTFSSNDLTSVTIGSGIQYINYSAFRKSSSSNTNLESITFTSKTCEEIKNIEASSTSTTKYFPWLYSSSPYYQEGYTATIIGTDGECSY